MIIPLIGTITLIFLIKGEMMKTRIDFYKNNTDIDMLIKMDLLFAKIDKFIALNKNKPKTYLSSDIIYLKNQKINIDFTGNVIADVVIVEEVFKGSKELLESLRNIISTVGISSGNRIAFGYNIYYLSDSMLEKFKSNLNLLNEIISTRDISYP